MIQREALGNDLTVAVAQGRLVRLRPTAILVKKDCAEFTVTGGLGYLPFTLTGLSRWRGPVLEEKTATGWTVIDQSTHGKDFWQTDYDVDTRTWQISYSVPVDRPDDHACRVPSGSRCDNDRRFCQSKATPSPDAVSPSRETVSPAAVSRAVTSSAASGATMRTKPTPMLNTRNISASATRPLS